MSEGGFLQFLAMGFYSTKCAFCNDDYTCNAWSPHWAYLKHWEQFIRRSENSEEGVKYLVKFNKNNALRRPYAIEDWERVRFSLNMRTYLQFLREKQRLSRQIVHTSNKLTRVLPTELVQLIWSKMANTTLQPILLAPEDLKLVQDDDAKEKSGCICNQAN